jgi:excisionase family DNA binding protein
MENTALIINGTPEEIAEGLQRFADRNATPKPAPTFEDEKMTVAQAANYVGISYKTLCKLISEKRITCWGTNRKRFVLKSELIEDLKNLK